MLAEADADGWLRDALARALEANGRWEQLAAELRAENARLRAERERRAAELARVNAELAVLQRLLFGRSSERARPDAAGQGDEGAETAVPGTGLAAAGPEGSGGRGRGRAGGTTRTCPRWS